MAVLIGIIVLAQIPKPIEITAVGLVIAGVLTHQEQTAQNTTHTHNPTSTTNRA